MADYIAKASANGETLQNYDHGAAGPVNIMDGDSVVSSVDRTSNRPAAATSGDVSPVAATGDNASFVTEQRSQLTPEEKDRLDCEDFRLRQVEKRAAKKAELEAAAMSASTPAPRTETALSDSEMLASLHAAYLAVMTPKEQSAGVGSQPPTTPLQGTWPDLSPAVSATTSDTQDRNLDLSPLGLGFLGYLTGQRARTLVVFRGAMGIMTVPYHAVIVTPKLVALVYDTRYDQGVQFLPAVTADKLEVDVPSQNTGAMKCASLDISWSLGCMDIAVLLRE